MNTQDNFQVLQSKPLTEAERAELYVRNSFVCPVCLQTGGPTFEGKVAFQNYVMAYGLSIPSDHIEKCLPIAEKDFQYFVKGRLCMEDHPIHLSGLPCMHPYCVADRVWREPL